MRLLRLAGIVLAVGLVTALSYRDLARRRSEAPPLPTPEPVLMVSAMESTGAGSRALSGPGAPAPRFRFDQSFSFQGRAVRVTAWDLEGSASLDACRLSVGPRGADPGTTQTFNLVGKTESAWVRDLDGDKQMEILVLARSAGSGSYGTLKTWEWSGSALVERPGPLLPEWLAVGYMGHDEFIVGENRLSWRFPFYREGDSNARPTGGKRTAVFEYAAKAWRMEPGSGGPEAAPTAGTAVTTATAATTGTAPSTRTASLRPTTGSLAASTTSTLAAARGLAFRIQPAAGNPREVRCAAVSGLADAVLEKKVNDQLRVLAMDLRAGLGKAVDPRDELRVDSQVTLLRPGVVSVRCHGFRSSPKLAHPEDAYGFLTVDLGTGRAVDFDALLADPAARPRLEALARTQMDGFVKKKGITLLKPYGGLGKQPRFFLSEEGLVLFHPPYEYTPRVAGPVELLIPYAELKGLVRFPPAAP